MKKFLFILFLLIPSIAWGVPPSRVATYSTGSVISSTDVTANEDALFNYVQAGVDTYKDLSIVDADISASANIQSDKLNLTSIEQAVAITSAGSFTNGGTTDLNGATTIGNAITDTLVIDAGTWTLTNATTWTLTGALTISGTIANLGIVTTADINGGTMDGVQIGGTTATGELIVNDASDDADGLGSQGTTGQFLRSAGAGANPTWVSSISLLSTTTLAAAGNSGDIAITAGRKYRVYIELSVINADATIYIRFDSDAGAADYAWNVDEVTYAGVSAITGDASDSEIEIGTVNGTNGILFMILDIDSTSLTEETYGVIFIHGEGTARDSAGVWVSRDMNGVYFDASTLTDFELLNSAGSAMTGSILVYELAI